MKTAPRSIDVFISSTFADMQKERDILARLVFPRIRKRLAQRNLTLRELDLRWGVTETMARDGGAIGVCLDGIERCAPFIFGMVGHRLGWVLDNAQLAPFLAGRDFVSVNEPSLTGLEMIYGAHLTNHYAEMKFPVMFRSERLSLQFNAIESEAQLFMQSKAMRQLLSSCPQIDPIYYDSLDEFEEKSEQSLTSLLDKVGHVSQGHGRARTDQLIARPKIEKILTKAAGAKAPLLVHAMRGAGATSLITKWASHREATLYLDGRIDDLEKMADKLDDFAQVHKGPGSAQMRMATALLALNHRNEQHTVIFDHLEAAQHTESHIEISWIPARLSKKMAVIVTTANERLARQAYDLRWSTLELPLIERETAMTIARLHLSAYGKVLTDEQSLRLQEAPWASELTAQKLALDELRRYGSYESLDQRLDEICRCHNHLQLIDEIVLGIANSLPAPWHGMIAPVMVTIAISSKGLSIDEICQAAGALVHGTHYQGRADQIMPQRFWDAVGIAMSPLLAERDGRIDLRQGIAEEWVSQQLKQDQELGPLSIRIFRALLDGSEAKREFEERPRIALFENGIQGLEELLSQSQFAANLMEYSTVHLFTLLDQLSDNARDRLTEIWHNDLDLQQSTKKQLMAMAKVDEVSPDISSLEKITTMDPEQQKMHLQALLNSALSGASDDAELLVSWVLAAISGTIKTSSDFLSSLRYHLPKIRKIFDQDYLGLKFLQVEGQLCILAGEYKRALKLFSAMESKARQFGLAGELCQALERQAAIGLEINKFAKARKWAESCLELSQAANLSKVECLAFERLIELEKRRANWSQAYTLATQYIERAQTGVLPLHRAKAALDDLEC